MGGPSAHRQSHDLPPGPGRVQAEAVRRTAGGDGFCFLGEGVSVRHTRRARVEMGTFTW